MVDPEDAPGRSIFSCRYSVVVPHFAVHGSVEGLTDQGRRRGVVVGGLGRDLSVDVGVERFDLGRLPVVVPSEDGCDDGRDRLGGVLPPVRGFVVQPHPPLQDVTEVDGPLRGGRVVGFDAQVAFGAFQRLTEFGILIDEVEKAKPGMRANLVNMDGEGKISKDLSIEESNQFRIY